MRLENSLFLNPQQFSSQIKILPSATEFMSNLPPRVKKKKKTLEKNGKTTL